MLAMPRALPILLVLLANAQAFKISVGVPPYDIPIVNGVAGAGALACTHVNERNPILAPALRNLSADFKLNCTIERLWDDDLPHGVERVQKWVEDGVDAVVGPPGSRLAQSMSVVADAYHMSVVSYWADGDGLSDKELFPNFARTIPVFSLVARATVGVMKELNWRNFGIIYSTQTAEWFEAFAAAATDFNMNLASSQIYRRGDEMIENDLHLALEKIARSGVRIIVDMVHYTDYHLLAKAFEDLGLDRREFQMISPMRQQTKTFFDDDRPDADAQYNFIRGTMTVAIESFGSAAARDKFHKAYGEAEQDALWAALPAGSSRVAELTASPCIPACGFLYDAIVAVALGLDGAASSSPVRSDALLGVMKSLQFQSASGRVAFDDNMDREQEDIAYVVFSSLGADPVGRWVEPVTIGSYQLGGRLQRFEEADFEWTSYERGWGKLMDDPSACSPGTQYSTRTLRCDACPPGTANDLTAGACRPCAPGTHASNAGTVLCVPCGSDGYAEESGATECAPCPPNHEVRATVDAGISITACVCRAGYVMGCRVHVWQVGVLAVAVVLVLMALVGTVLWTRFRARAGGDAEEQAVEARVALLRTLLFLDQKDGFSVDGEWRARGTRLKKRQLQHLARMTLLLECETAQVDALASQLLFSVDAAGAPRGADGAATPKQFTAMMQVLLETSKNLLDPRCGDGWQGPSGEGQLSWMTAPSALERFEFLTQTVCKLKLWDDGDNFGLLKGVAQLFLDHLRVSCDHLYHSMGAEEGAEALRSLALAQQHSAMSVTRQDHPDVKAVPLVDSLESELETVRMQAVPDQWDRGEVSARPLPAQLPLPPVLAGAEETSSAENPALMSSATDVKLKVEAGVASEQVLEAWMLPGGGKGAEAAGKGRRWLWVLAGWGREKEREQALQRYRNIQEALQEQWRTKSNWGRTRAERLSEGVEHEEAYVQLLANRARALNPGFQDALLAIDWGEHAPQQVYAGPLKRAQRMAEKVVEYRREHAARGERVQYPLAAEVLDPVRASVICSSTKHVVGVVNFLIEHGPAIGLPVVKLKNKFAASDSSEFDGYRDVMLCVVYTGSKGLKIIGEIQVQDVRMNALKLQMHLLYQVKRATSASRLCVRSAE